MTGSRRSFVFADGIQEKVSEASRELMGSVARCETFVAENDMRLLESRDE